MIETGLEKSAHLEETTVHAEDAEYWRYVYAYPREDNPHEIKVDVQQPYTIKTIIQLNPDQKSAVFILEAPSIDKLLGTLNSPQVEEVQNLSQYNHFFAEDEHNFHFAMRYEDFCAVFDEIVYSNYSLMKRYNY
jgi:hypothetical protein